jgi:hypothetical protein
LRLLAEQIREIETARLERQPDHGAHPMIRLQAGWWSRQCDRRYARPRGVLAQLARPPGRGALRRSDGLAGRERRAAAGERGGPGGQRRVRRGMR